MYGHGRASVFSIIGGSSSALDLSVTVRDVGSYQESLLSELICKLSMVDAILP